MFITALHRSTRLRSNPNILQKVNRYKENWGSFRQWMFLCDKKKWAIQPQKVKRFVIKTAKSKKSILKDTYWIILLNDTFKKSTMNKTKISSSQESRKLARRSSVDFKGLKTSLGYRYSLVSIFFIIWMKKQWWMLCDLKYLPKSIKHTTQFIFY